MTLRISNASRRAMACIAIALALHVALALAVGTIVIRAVRGNVDAFDDVVVAFDDIPTKKERARFVPAARDDLPRVDDAAGESTDISDSLAKRLDAPPPSLEGRLADRVREGYTTSGIPATSSHEALEAQEVSFVGVKARRATSVAYVVDASGSLVGTLPVVLDELKRSLDRLSPAQRFGVVFFQRNQAVVAPGAKGLRDASARAVSNELAWIDANVRPSGRSNPLEALELALSWKPDVLFFLATSITGSGEFEISRDDLLARLDKLNPRDERGARRTRIHCIQFLDPDPLDTLRKIAAAHGGSEAFRYLSRAELGLNPAPPAKR